MVSFSRLMFVALFVVACSTQNREGLDLSCGELQNGGINACREGIITSCVSGTVRYEVCNNENACEASWQTRSRYRCKETEPLPALVETPMTTGSGGAIGTTTSPATANISVVTSSGTTGGSGGASSTSVCGFNYGAACASCMQANCCAESQACADDAQCVECLTRGADETPCLPDLVPRAQTLVQCQSMYCSEDC